MNIFKKLREYMTDILDDLEPKVAQLHSEAGVTDAALAAKVTDAVKAAVTDITTKYDQEVADLKKVISDTLDKLNNNDVAGATATVQASAGDTSTPATTQAAAPAKPAAPVDTAAIDVSKDANTVNGGAN